MVVDVFKLLCSVCGSESDCSLVIAQAFVAGEPESGHIRRLLGSDCPRTVAGTQTLGQGSPWPGAGRGKGGLRRGEAG